MNFSSNKKEIKSLMRKVIRLSLSRKKYPYSIISQSPAADPDLISLIYQNGLMIN